MKKSLLIIALVLAGISIFFQYKSIEFAGIITERIQAFGQVLANDDQAENITDIFFDHAEEIRLCAHDSFVSQQFSTGMLCGAIICMVIALLFEKKPHLDSDKKD